MRRTAGAAGVAAGGAFVAVAIGQAARRARAADRALAGRLSERRHPALDRLAGTCQLVGSVEAIGAAAWGEVMWRLRAGERRAALEPVLFTATIPLEYMLKVLLPHPAPAQRAAAAPPILSIRTRNSFPSGHSVRVAFVLTRWVLRRPLGKRLPVALVAALTAGWSRVYLGEHWPSDVLGGFCLGCAAGALATAWASDRTTRTEA